MPAAKKPAEPKAAKPAPPAENEAEAAKAAALEEAAAAAGAVPLPALPPFVGYEEDGVTYPAIVTPAGLVVFGLPTGPAELRQGKE